MTEKRQVIIVGSHAPGIFMRVKRAPMAGETVIGWDYHEPMDGGKGSNQAIAAARLGGQACFIGCVGRDRIGDEGIAWMKAAGVDTTWLKRHEKEPSGVGFILLDENGIPAMVTSMGANAELLVEDIDDAFFHLPDARVLLTQFEIRPQVSLYAARQAKKRGIISIVNPAPAPDFPMEGLDAASILVPNETELKTLLGLPAENDYDMKALAQRLQRETGVECVLVTLGEDGLTGATRCGECWSVRPPAVDVVDTSGAGDAFCAALAVSLAEGNTVQAASRWAVWAATLSVSKAGTIPSYPTRAEVAEFMRRQPIDQGGAKQAQEL